MRGITTAPYRTAFIRHFSGLDAAMAPFVPTVSAERIHPRLVKDLLPEHNGGLPLVPQLIGNNAADFVQMARVLHDLGYEEVNWNMGCPHKPIRKKRRGSGLLPHPDLVDRLLDHACAHSPCRITVKVRLGVADKAELAALAPVLNRHPLGEVVIHPRTAEQMYYGSVDLDAFAEAYAALAHPVCYNGDIGDLSFFIAVRDRFPGIGRFMLGRGLLADPFLCESIKAPSLSHFMKCDNAVSRIAAFHADLLARYEEILHGDRPVLGKMKECWTYLALHLSNGDRMFKKVKKTQTLAAYKAIVDECLAEAQWRPDTNAFMPPEPCA